MPAPVSLFYLKALCQQENPPLWTRYEHIRALNFGCVMTWDQNYVVAGQQGAEQSGQTTRGLALSKNPSDRMPIYVERRTVGNTRKRAPAVQLEVLGQFVRVYNVLWKSTYIDKQKKKGSKVGTWLRSEMAKAGGQKGMFMRTPWLQKNIEHMIWDKRTGRFRGGTATPELLDHFINIVHAQKDLGLLDVFIREFLGIVMSALQMESREDPAFYGWTPQNSPIPKRILDKPNRYGLVNWLGHAYRTGWKYCNRPQVQPRS